MWRAAGGDGGRRAIRAADDEADRVLAGVAPAARGASTGPARSSASPRSSRRMRTPWPCLRKQALRLHRPSSWKRSRLPRRRDSRAIFRSSARARDSRRQARAPARPSCGRRRGCGCARLRAQALVRRRARRRRGVRRPDALEIVELAHFRPEDVDDDVAGIDQHPVGIRQAFDAHFRRAGFLELAARRGRRAPTTWRAERPEATIIASAIGDFPASGMLRMFSALSSSSCCATRRGKLERIGRFGLAAPAWRRLRLCGGAFAGRAFAAAGPVSVVLPVRVGRLTDRALSFVLLNRSGSYHVGADAARREGLSRLAPDRLRRDPKKTLTTTGQVEIDGRGPCSARNGRPFTAEYIGPAAPTSTRARSYVTLPGSTVSPHSEQVITGVKLWPHVVCRRPLLRSGVSTCVSAQCAIIISTGCSARPRAVRR